jgi:hypothetical protein
MALLVSGCPLQSFLCFVADLLLNEPCCVELYEHLICWQAGLYLFQFHLCISLAYLCLKQALAELFQLWACYRRSTLNMSRSYAISIVYGGTKSQDSFWAKIRQNSTVRETRGYPFRYTCAGV